MAVDDEAKFNSSLKTSDCIREWCTNVGEFLAKPVDYSKAHHLLWMLNNEIYGWYSKKNSLDEFNKLEEFEKKADEVSCLVNSIQSRAVYGRVLKNWARKAIEQCYFIGWLAKENENIYDSESMLD